jgi:hypothetical protein
MSEREAQAFTRRSLLVASAVIGCIGASGCKQSGPASCNDVSRLTPEEVTARSTLGYVERTPEPDKPCDKCQQYVPAAPGSCGACKVLKGPVHPNGYCRVFVAL